MQVYKRLVQYNKQLRRDRLKRGDKYEAEGLKLKDLESQKALVLRGMK